MKNEISVEVKLEFSKVYGYAAIYVKFRAGKIHKTIEVTEEVNADTDREGRLIGVEIIRSFAPTEGGGKLSGSFDLEEIQAAVERKIGVKVDSEFTRFREAANVLSPGV